MTRDYSSYTIAELKESLAAVNGEQYPENKQALELALQERIDSGEVELERRALEERAIESELSFIETAVRARAVLAWYFLLSSVYLPISSILNLLFWPELHSTNTLGYLYIAFFGLASFVSGFGLLKKKAWGHWTAVAFLALQIPFVQSKLIFYQASPIINLYFYVSSSGDIGFNASVFGGAQFNTGVAVPFAIGLNLLAVAAIAILLTARNGELLDAS